MFVLFCLITVGIPLAILYALFGRPGSQPVTVVRRASLAAIPQVAPAGAGYEPERVFAYEQQVQLENARKVIQVHVAPRGGIVPPPLPRSRAARGTGAPAVRHETAGSAVREDPTNPFGEEAPTMPGDRR